MKFKLKSHLLFFGLLVISSTLYAQGGFTHVYNCSQPSCSTGWVPVGPDDVVTVEITCNPPYPVLNWNNIPVKTDHWTMSCYLQGGGNDWYGVRCENFNTIWGATHHFNVTWYCQANNNSQQMR